MKTLGIIGGLTPESTVEYYRKVIGRYHQFSQGEFPPIAIQSVPLDLAISYQSKNDLAGLAKLLGDAGLKLKAAGADFLVLASNTVHSVYQEVKDLTHLPMISIVETTASRAEIMSPTKKVGLLGTTYTMQADFYQKCFNARGMEIFTPEPKDQKFIQQIIFEELALGIFAEATRLELLKIIKRLQDKYQIDTVILGCTELPLIIKQSDCPTTLLDTIEIHVDAIMAELRRKYKTE